jgi:hypothetical protein
VATVVRIAPSIVSSNTMMMLGHHAKVGSPPTSMVHQVSVIQLRPSPPTSPASPPPHASHHIHVALSRRPNSKPSIGCDDMTVMAASASPAAFSRLTACWADGPSG